MGGIFLEMFNKGHRPEAGNLTGFKSGDPMHHLTTAGSCAGASAVLRISEVRVDVETGTHGRFNKIHMNWLGLLIEFFVDYVRNAVVLDHFIIFSGLIQSQAQ